ncbi:MAG: SIS domain-containing protein [Ktedonobacteraceae bacterium]|nr:SIS domain-containing protein [Ktedonobacteraceae bacterium]
MDQQLLSMELFWQESSRVLQQLVETQTEVLRQAARLFADCIGRDGVVHSYGTGHSRAFAMELAGRAGGLVAVNRLDLEDLALYKGWPLERVMHPDFERDPEGGKALLSCYQIEPQDLFLIVSNSGTNSAIMDVALDVKQRGHTLITVTSMAHTSQMVARHSSGKKLYEVADLVIDNCAPFGDALLGLPEGGKACSISSMTGALIAQMLTAETIRLLHERGKVAPVYLSSNVPGGIEHNQVLVRHYGKRIRPV